LSRFIFIACIIILIALAIIQAPAFVIVSDPPVKSDAVVLFIGNDRGTREKEANQLMQEGFAEYLIIPAYRQIKKLGPDGTLIRIEIDVKLNSLKHKTSQGDHLKPKTSNLKPALVSASNQSTNKLTNQRTRFFEDTHQEALIARDMMEQYGMTSAIFVSSPYHMRRLMLIADKVFGERATVCYVPTRYEAPVDGLWLLNNDRKFVLTEYAKIAWFILYSPFV
jgi:uncharacterized SAM-binding protein YcdF (DUF218 family)